MLYLIKLKKKNSNNLTYTIFWKAQKDAGFMIILRPL